MKTCAAWAALAAAIILGAAAWAEEPAASITIHCVQTVGPVNPWIFGTNTLGYQKSAWHHTSPDYSNRGSGSGILTPAAPIPSSWPWPGSQV